MPKFPTTPIIGNVAGIRDLSGNYNLSQYVRDTVQRHALGRRFITDLGSVFKHWGVGGTLNTDLLAQTITAQHMAYGNVAASTSIGDTKITLDFASDDGPGANGEIAEDEAQGGTLILFPHSENSMSREIRHNTVVAAGGGEITLTLDFPLNIATVVDVTHGEFMASPYWSVKASTTGDTARGFVGLPCAPGVSGEWGWGLTWGPCWVAPQGDVGTGASNIQVVARYDGSIQAHDYTDTTYSDKQQHVGFVLSHAYAGTQGAPFIMLQISI